MAPGHAGANLPASALFSFWRVRGSIDPADFVGSGVCVAPGLVLTARHLLEGGRTLWAHHTVGGVEVFPVEVVREHDKYDVVLVRVETHDPRVGWLRCDRHTPVHPGDPLRAHLAGFFEGRLEVGLDLKVLNHDATVQPPHFVTDLKQPAGHSGSGVLVGGALWGLAVRHYVDPNVHRGCVVALSQFWDDLLADVLPTAGPSGAPTSSDRGVPDAELCDRLLRQLRDLFARPPLSAWRWATPAEGGLPEPLVRVFAKRDRQLGGQLLRLLANDLLPRLQADTETDELQIDDRAARRIRNGLLVAVDLAAKLCMDPRQRAALALFQGRIDMPGTRAVAATLALQDDAMHALEPVPGHPAQKARPRYAVAYGLEHGVGDDQRYGLASLIASQKSSRNLNSEPVRLSTPEQLADWRSFLRNERDARRGRLILLTADQQQALGRDMEEWLQDFGVTVVALVGDRSGFYWFDEGDLVGAVQGVLASFAEHPLWKGTHAP